MAEKKQPDPTPGGATRPLVTAQGASTAEAGASNDGPPGRPAGWSQKIWFRAGLLGVMILALGMQAWLFLGQVYWVSADESGRTEHAWAWITFKQHDGLKGLMDVWLPLPHVLLGLSLKYLSPNLFLTPRLITAFFSVLALIGFLLLAHELFESRPVTLAAGLLAALYAQRVVLSVVPLVEIQYLAWLLLGEFFALRGFKRGGRWTQLAAAASFALAMMARYEAWIFSGVYFALLVGWAIRDRRRVPWPLVGACGLILAAFPAFWILLYARFTDHPLGFIEGTSGVYQKAFGNLWKRNFYFSVVYQCYKENLRQLNLLGLLGVAAWIRRKDTPRAWLLIPACSFVALAVLGVLGKAMPTHNFWRIGTIWGLTLIPFTAALCVQDIPGWCARLARWPGGRSKVLAAVLVLALAGLFLRDTDQKRIYFKAPSELVQTGLALRRAMAESKARGEKPFRILLERGTDWNYPNIEMMALSFGRFTLSTGFNRANLNPPPQEPQRSQYLARLKAESFRLLVFRTAALKRILMTYPGVRTLASFGAYTIFELK